MKLTDTPTTNGNIIFSGYDIFIIETTDDFIIEAWGSSTKHPDRIYRFSEWGDETNILTRKEQIPQWLLYIGSRQIFPYNAKKYCEIALDMMTL